MAGKDVFPSGKGRKRPEISGNRYSGFLWERDRKGSKKFVALRHKRAIGIDTKQEDDFFL